MDIVGFPAVAGLRPDDLPPIQRTVLRWRLQGAAWRVVGSVVGRGPAVVPELGSPDPPPDLHRAAARMGRVSDVPPPSLVGRPTLTEFARARAGARTARSVLSPAPSAPRSAERRRVGSRLLHGIAARAGSVALKPTALERRVIRVSVPDDHVKVCHRGGAFRDGRDAAG